MQRRIDDEIQLGKIVTPFDSIGKSKAINRTASNVDNANGKLQKTKRLINKGEYYKDVSRYIPGTFDLMLQGMTENMTTKEQVADMSYRDMESLEFQTFLTQNHYTNPNSFHIDFLIKIKKATTINNDINVDDLITVNIFFTHRIKEINITKYGCDKQLIPTSSPYEVYQYSDAKLKHLPKKLSYKIEKLLLFSKKAVAVLQLT